MAHIVGTENDDTLTGTLDADLIEGLAGNDTLSGLGGNDTLAGGAGADALVGGAGSDTADYSASPAAVTVSLATNTGSGGDAQGDTLSGIENLTGSAFADTLTAGGGGGAMMGGLGSDTMYGGDGSDGLYGEGDYGWSQGGDDILYGGAGDDLLHGGPGNDQLFGGPGDDLFDPIFDKMNNGADAMAGGPGNDRYTVDDPGDTVTEQPGEGTDLVESTITYTLGPNVENLRLEDSFVDGHPLQINGTGNELANVITGNGANNVLSGLAGNDTLNSGDGGGNDTLDGGTGADAMAGGEGNDLYYVDDPGDVVTEAGEGTDSVSSTFTYTLPANVENLTLTGTAAINGTGNELANVITGDEEGNVLAGLAGNDTLNGQAGNDRLAGGAGADVLIGGAGSVDTASYDTSPTGVTVSLVTNTGSGGDAQGDTLSGIENLSGSVFADTLTGDGSPNELSGGGGNDTLDGGGGDDGLNGGDGNDVLYGGDGNDRINGEDFPYPPSEELFGNDVIYGGAGNDTLSGGVGNDELFGGPGDDRLDAHDKYGQEAGGADALDGGPGNDLYAVDNPGDTVTEKAGEGTDEVVSSITYTLPANVENLTLAALDPDGFSPQVNGTGNDLANVITGNKANNVLSGLAGDDLLLGDVQGVYGEQGDDTLDGGIGADTMAGGGGNDLYYVDNAGDTVSEKAGEGTDSVSSSITYTLTANVENLTLTGTAAIDGTGNELANVLTGNDAANVLSGLAGNDTLSGAGGNDTLDGGAGGDKMAGGAGNDLYLVDNTGDTATENASAGTDEVRSSVTFTLGANVENLTLTGTAAINGTGNALANVLTGNSAANVLTGGAGNDTYIVGGENGVFDSVVEKAGEGTDLVQSAGSFALPANVENLTLIGRTAGIGDGNDLANTLTGSEADNVLSGFGGNDTLYGGAGNDILDGGGGANTLAGGVGDDIYRVLDARDAIIEASGEGTDLVQSAVTITLAANVENLTLTGTAAINGSGNESNNSIVGNDAANVLSGLAGNDTLSGGGGNDTLDGGTGADAMAGGVGNDTYLVDDAGDAITEANAAGTDSVSSTVTYTLGANLENLTLTGAVNINGSGNELGNILTGNTGNNVLTGAAGNDIVNGGAGFDTAVFSGAVASYHFTENGAQVTVSGPDGTDTLTSIEQLSFGNLTFSIADRSHFDPLFYLNQNPDVAGAAVDPLTHYQHWGWAEGRDPNPSVDLAAVDGLEYIASYSDLINAFGANKDAGYQHFATQGLFEGRTTSFDGLEYIASYGDLIKAFGANTDAGASHYIGPGHTEGRTTSFDGLEYIASYGDLIHAFGANTDAGASHYIGPGHTEGRHVSFDGLEYIASYGDLINAFHNQVTASPTPEDIGATHYIGNGYAEHRAPDLFDAAQYLANYADLQAAFGTDAEVATLHYISFGYFEGRTDHHLT